MTGKAPPAAAGLNGHLNGSANASATTITNGAAVSSAGSKEKVRKVTDAGTRHLDHCGCFSMIRSIRGDSAAVSID